jgi:fibronectin type 3 domain-containing protein
MKQIITSVLVAILAVLTQPIFGQNPPHQYSNKIPVHLKLLTRNQGDKIILRWAFSEPEAWRWVNTQGWVLERFELDNATNKAISSTLMPLTPTPIKAWAKEEWQNRINTKDTLALVAAECLLGDSKMPAANMMRQLDLQVKDEANRFSFALLAADFSALAAEGLGLRFTDKDVKPNRKYVYRLHIVPDAKNNRFVTDTVLAMVNSNQISEIAAPNAPEATSGDSLINLRWERVKGYTAYHIERSADGGKTWQQLNQKPFINMNEKGVGDPNSVFFSDRLTANYVKYQYRLRGITPFAEITEASPAVESQGIDLTPTVAPVMTAAKNTKGLTVELKWDCAPAADLRGFMVAKSPSIDGPWYDLTKEPLAPSVKTITDEGEEFGTNFYRVYSIDDHNNRNGSYPAYVQMTNQAPPAAPVWSKTNCKIDTAGKVTLTWAANTEPDLWGYQVWFANQADHEFMPVSSDILTDTTFSFPISLKNLSEKIYYRVMALDKNYLMSKASETLELRKPDKIAPVAPVFHDYTVSEKGIQLKWHKSSSDDTETQALMRRKAGKEWEKIADLPKHTEGYLDEKVKSHTLYEYWIVCTDDAGLQSSKDRTLTIRSITLDTRPKIDNLKGKAKGEGIELSWQYAIADATYKVFRITGNTQLTAIGKVEKGQPMVFEDTQAERGKEYRYAVKAFHANGETSQLAQSEIVKMNP